MIITVYTVGYTLMDDILGGEQDNIYSTRDGAIAAAKKLFKQRNIYSVDVYKAEVTPTGMHTLGWVYKDKKSEEEYLKYNSL